MRFSYTLLVARCQAALAKNESSSLSLCYIIILTIRSQWYSGLRPNAEWHTYIILGLLRTLPALPQFLSMCGYIIKLSLEVCIDECTCIWPLFVIYKTISKSQTAGQAIRWLWVSMKSIVEVDYTGLDWHLFYVFFFALTQLRVKFNVRTDFLRSMECVHSHTNLRFAAFLDYIFVDAYFCCCCVSRQIRCHRPR